MNNARRKDLSIAHRLLEIAREIVEDVKIEEFDAHENLPENMQFNTERSDEMQEAINAMGTIISEIESAEHGLVPFTIDISSKAIQDLVTLRAVGQP